MLDEIVRRNQMLETTCTETGLREKGCFVPSVSLVLDLFGDGVMIEELEAGSVGRI